MNRNPRAPHGVQRVRIPRPASVGLMLSYRCSAACRHCMYACSPRWQGDWIPQQELQELLSVLKDTIVPSPWGEETISLNYGLHFTGGEPFLNYDLLLQGVQVAAELGIPSTFVETNCYWCREDGATLERLTSLRRAGLHGIMISVNPYYAEYVPFERTERCVCLSQRVFGRNVMVYQQDYYALFRKLGIAGRISLEEYAARAGSDRPQVELFLMGRAARQLKAAYPAYPARRFFGESCRPSFLRNWHNHVDNYGNLVPGYCGGISLGHWRDLGRLVDSGIDLTERPVLRHLIAEDVEGLLGFCQDLGYRELAEGYVSKCDLCLDLRAYLVSQGEWAELQPRAFYEHLGSAAA